MRSPTTWNRKCPDSITPAWMGPTATWYGVDAVHGTVHAARSGSWSQQRPQRLVAGEPRPSRSCASRSSHSAAGARSTIVGRAASRPPSRERREPSRGDERRAHLAAVGRGGRRSGPPSASASAICRGSRRSCQRPHERVGHLASPAGRPPPSSASGASAAATPAIAPTTPARGAAGRRAGVPPRRCRRRGPGR